MKKEKTIFGCFILFLIFGCFTVQSQQPGQIYVIPKNLEQKGDVLEIEMVFDMSNLRMRQTESRTYTPIITANKKEYELPRLVIKGSRRYKFDSRDEKLSNRPVITVRNQGGEKNYAIYAVEKYNKKGIVPYKVTIPYREWMKGASLNLREETCGCCNKPKGVTLQKNIFDQVPADNYKIQPRFSYLVPEKEPQKNRYEIGKAYLDFPQGKSVIDPQFRNNRSELDKINQMIVMIASDPDVTVNNIEMRGYASPESSQKYNYELSSQRAQAMRDYFAHMSSISSGLFRTGIGGEDWDGLKSLLMNYSVAYKKEILNIINTVYDQDAREQRIKELGGGESYRQILRDLYPQLRRVDCQINYTVRNFTIDEGKERILKKPKLLSQNEMYQVARTYPEGSKEFNQALLTAQEYFPGNDIANLNGAAAALSEGDTKLAEEYLKQIQNTSLPEYANCMGVLFTFKGNYDAAEDYLKKAQAAGVTEATYNLRELQKKREQQSAAPRK